MSLLNFQGKAVVITDANDGVGRGSATVLAARGASLAINFPPSRSANTSPFLRQLRQLGGQVTATYEELEDCHKTVEKCISEYGAAHIVIYTVFHQDNEASDYFGSATSSDLFRKTGLKGLFKCVKAVWPYFKKQANGRLIFATSVAQRNCLQQSTTRFALAGLVQTLAKEGAKYNITVNLVGFEAPSFVTNVQKHAMSRETHDYINSMVSFLSHEKSKDHSGSMFECGTSSISNLKWDRAMGTSLNPDTGFTAAALLNAWSGMDDFSGSTFPSGPMNFALKLRETQSLKVRERRPELRFDGQVVIVTGAASGLGRCYARAFAKLGAAVLVNDQSDPAAVVQELVDEGGVASGCIASVSDGEMIVKAAIEAYGRIDILINNAGIVRDKSFLNMDESSWKSVLDVHLGGTYLMTKAVWPHFVKQGHGRIVNTTSTSGIYGSFGQANYSTAKLGILGISEASAREGLKHNILINTIAPVASTAALAQVLPDTDKNAQPIFKPEYVVPIVLLLSSHELGELPNPTGGLFEVGCGWHARTRLHRSVGYRTVPGFNTTPESIVQSWSELPGSDPTAILEKIEELKRKESGQSEYRYEDRDVILYNISVGASHSDLSLIYERSANFSALPTFGAMPFINADAIGFHASILPNFSLSSSLLGEHYLEILQFPIPTLAHLVSTRRILEVLDKGPGLDKSAVCITAFTTTDKATGANLFYNEETFFMRGAGGFGGPKTLLSSANASNIRGSKNYPSPTTRPPDAVTEYKTSTEQAALYRLAGDRMAIHIDPVFARQSGLDAPILHGSCTMGIAGKHASDKFGEFRSIKARFTGVVVPGQTVRTEMWKHDRERDLVLFRVTVVETKKVCIDRGWLRLRGKSEGSRL